MSESGTSPTKPLEANHDSVKQSPHVEEKSKLVEGKLATSTEVPEGDVEQKPNSREGLLSGQKLGRNIQNSPSEPIFQTTANTTKITENSSQMSSLGEPSPKLPPIEPNTKNIELSPRPQMIAQAVSFLNSANVQTAPLSKKLAFLKSKGLTQTEIDMAVKKASLEKSNTGHLIPSNGPSNNSSTNLSSAPRRYPQTPSVPGEIAPHTAPNPNTERIRKMIVAFMITGGLAAGLLGLIKLAVLPIRNSLTKMQHVHYEQQSDNLQKFHEQLASYSLKFPQKKQGSEESMIKSLEKSSDGLRQALQKFETQLMVYQEIGKSRGRTMNEVRYAFYDLTRSLGTAGHFSVYKLQAEHRAGLPAQIRSEIRSIKGLLLSRRTPLNNPFQQSMVT